MLKSSLKVVEVQKNDPNKAIAEAISDSTRRSDEQHKALIEAVKGIVMKAPDVSVAAPQVKVQMPENKKPTKWTFTMNRNADGLLESITAISN
jgi:TPP-dependent pyruvate/acetoin dehydrogenase alpha subunit